MNSTVNLVSCFFTQSISLCMYICIYTSFYSRLLIFLHATATQLYNLCTQTTENSRESKRNFRCRVSCCLLQYSVSTKLLLIPDLLHFTFSTSQHHKSKLEKSNPVHVPTLCTLSLPSICFLYMYKTGIFLIN